VWQPIFQASTQSFALRSDAVFAIADIYCPGQIRSESGASHEASIYLDSVHPRRAEKRSRDQVYCTLLTSARGTGWFW